MKIKTGTKPGSVAEEIVRLVSTRSEDNTVAPMLTMAAIGFAEFVLGLVAFNTENEEMPTIPEAIGIMNGSDVLQSIRLWRSVSSFLPVWFDSALPDDADNFSAEKITDAYNEFVMSKQ